MIFVYLVNSSHLFVSLLVLAHATLLLTQWRVMYPNFLVPVIGIPWPPYACYRHLRRKRPAWQLWIVEHFSLFVFVDKNFILNARLIILIPLFAFMCLNTPCTFPQTLRLSRMSPSLHSIQRLLYHASLSINWPFSFLGIGWILRGRHGCSF